MISRRWQRNDDFARGGGHVDEAWFTTLITRFGYRQVLGATRCHEGDHGGFQAGAPANRCGCMCYQLAVFRAVNSLQFSGHEHRDPQGPGGTIWSAAATAWLSMVQMVLLGCGRAICGGVHRFLPAWHSAGPASLSGHVCIAWTDHGGFQPVIFGQPSPQQDRSGTQAGASVDAGDPADRPPGLCRPAESGWYTAPSTRGPRRPGHAGQVAPAFMSGAPAANAVASTCRAGPAHRWPPPGDGGGPQPLVMNAFFFAERATAAYGQWILLFLDSYWRILHSALAVNSVNVACNIAFAAACTKGIAGAASRAGLKLGRVLCSLGAPCADMAPAATRPAGLAAFCPVAAQAPSLSNGWPVCCQAPVVHEGRSGPQSKPSIAAIRPQHAEAGDAANVQHQHCLVRLTEHRLVEGGTSGALAACSTHRGCAGRTAGDACQLVGQKGGCPVAGCEARPVNSWDGVAPFARGAYRADGACCGPPSQQGAPPPA